MSDIEKRPYIGGQAVIEGVMMRSPKSFSIVVRRKSGELMVRERPTSPHDGPSRGITRWPFVRGVITMVEAVKLGSEALRFSSEIYERDHTDDDAPVPPRVSKGGALSTLAFAMVALALHEPDPRGEGASAPAEPDRARKLVSMVSIVFAVGFFVALPQAAAAFTNRGLGLALDLRSPLFQAMTGGFKLAIVVSYLLLIRRVPEICRVFQYHGAEHKTISTYEAEEPLDVAHARAKTTLHPRCGTTFFVMVALVSIVVFAMVAPAACRTSRWGLSRERRALRSEAAVSCRSSRRSPSKSSASSLATARPVLCACCCGRAFSCRRSPPSSPTTTSSRSRSRRCGPRCGASARRGKLREPH